MSVWKQTGVKPKELDDLKELPSSMYYQWKFFIDLHNKRTAGLGVNPLSWSDVLAYFTLVDYKPAEWELDLITKLDSIVLEIYAKKQEQQTKKKPK